jgi:peptidyl-Asp metalloendopeptidase
MILPAVTHAGGRPQALTEPMPATAQQLPAQARAETALIGAFRDSGLEAEQLELMFGDGHVASARMRSVSRDRSGAVQSWIGEFAGFPGSVLTLTRTRGVVAGFANYNQRTYELLPSADGRHVMFEVATERLPQGDEFHSNHGEYRELVGTGGQLWLDSEASAGTAEVAGTATTTATGVAVHDVLIYYTAASSNKWGQATLESMARSAVQAANLAYQNSLAKVALNVVGFKPSPVREASTMLGTVNALKSNATVRAERDSLAADMVLVLAENTDLCGAASLYYSWSGSTTNWDAYAGVNGNCLSTQALAHEIGHLQQLDHNKENSTGLAAYAYSYGYRLCTSGGFRDIMSYPCSMSVARANYFSNPNLTFNGYPLGNSYANSVRSLNETAAIAAAYRVGKTSTVATVPLSPTSLAATSVRYDRVAISWKDNSTNESGFKIQRSTDGVTYSQVASLGAGATSFADVSVSSLKTYYYRVAAYNSSGSSGYSNVLSVKTPGSVPVAPASVVATNGGNGTATVTWADKSNNETKFQVYRAKWDVASGTWLARTYVGYVGANVTRFVNSSGTGKFRFYVRAVNAYGSSSYAVSPDVTVTGS